MVHLAPYYNAGKSSKYQHICRDEFVRRSNRLEYHDRSENHLRIQYLVQHSAHQLNYLLHSGDAPLLSQNIWCYNQVFFV